MKPIPKSGYFNTNNFGRIALLSFEDALGKNGLNILLNLASLGALIDHYPPADMVKGFDFADYTAILVALEELYGPRGGRGLAVGAGRATFKDLLAHYGELAGVADLVTREIPLLQKMQIGLAAAAKTFNDSSDQLTSIEELEDTFIWRVNRCPACWSRQGADKPVCSVTVGFLQGSLKWLSGGHEFGINETKCCAVGDASCDFVIQKQPVT
jgi:predicted hydrocarbon binding protein